MADTHARKEAAAEFRALLGGAPAPASPPPADGSGKRSASPSEARAEQARAEADARLREAEERAAEVVRAAEERAGQLVREAEEAAEERAAEVVREAEERAAAILERAEHSSERREEQSRHAEEIVERARAEADELLEEARSRVEHLVPEAEERAQELVARAEAVAAEARERAEADAAARLAEAEERAAAVLEAAEARAEEHAPGPAGDREPEVRLDEQGASGEMLQALARSLRDPLSSLAGLLSTMSGRDLEDEVREDLVARARERSESLRSTVDRIVQLAGLRSGEISLQHEELPLGLLVERGVEAAGSVLGPRRVVTSVDDLGSVVADPVACDRVVAALLANAADFSPPDSVIRVHARAEGDDAVISVSDDGQGIRSEEQALVFEPFYRGSGRGPRDRSAGLGLALARAYVELQGGRIWVESRSAVGSSFYFTLPLATVESPPVRGDVPASAEGGAGTPPSG